MKQKNMTGWRIPTADEMKTIATVQRFRLHGGDDAYSPKVIAVFW